MELTLTFEEARLLKDVLEERQRELLRELSRAKHYAFKTTLKANERLLETVLEKLRIEVPVRSAD